jgi:hypothetical protein
MMFEYLKLSINIKDEEFDAIYPEQIRKLANRHFTPIAIAKQAAGFLSDKPGAKILDIGSGAGKFCMVGSVFTNGNFTGVEQREYLYRLSNTILECHHLPNVKFIHSNITQIKFTDYNAFYFFNSFHENVDKSARLDSTVGAGIELHTLYTQYVNEQLSQMPGGTRLVTYWSDAKEIPSEYRILYSDCGGKLIFWEKKK